MQLELIDNDERKTLRTYKGKPFRTSAAQRRVKRLADGQVAWLLKTHPEHALLFVVKD